MAQVTGLEWEISAMRTVTPGTCDMCSMIDMQIIRLMTITTYLQFNTTMTADLSVCVMAINTYLPVVG